MQGLTELPPFFSQSPPALHEPDRGHTSDVRELVEKGPSVGSVARIYTWGPKTGDWDTLGRWQTKWLSPFAGWPDTHASLPALPPPSILDTTRVGFPYASGYTSNTYHLAPGDDPSHALLVARRSAPGRPESVVFELEADRVPVEIRRADGEPFTEIEGSVRVAGRWFITATAAAGPGQATASTLLWRVEGAVARELVRIPRFLPDATTSGDRRARLARRSDGRALGLVVDGEPTAERPVAVRWVLPIDLETGAVGEPESLGYIDLAGRLPEACADDVVGWIFDAPMPGSTIRLRLPQGSTGLLVSIQSRLRLTGERVCVERLAGTFDGAGGVTQLSRPGAASHLGTLRAGELVATAASMGSRFPLRCTISNGR
jgi:hypothetical protein